MKRIMLLLLTTLMLAMLFACSTEKAENVEEATATAKEEEMNNANEIENVEEATAAVKKDEMNTGNKIKTEVKLVTKEQIMEYFDFTEYELEGIDVDAVIKYCQYTEEDIKKIPRDLFLMGLKLKDEKIKTDISYLFKGGQPDGKIPVSQIKTVAFLEGEDDANGYFQIRVKDKRAYYCPGYADNMDLEEECDCSGAITDEYIAELLSCLEKANLHKWKAVYEGDDNGSTGSWGWNLGIELIDGTVYYWRGWGMFGDNKPKEFESVKDIIDEVYNEIATES